MKLIRFLIVGSLACILQLTALAFFLYLMPDRLVSSATSAFAIAVVFHFLANHYFTFQLNQLPTILQIVRYLSMIAVNYTITIFTTVFVVNTLELSPYIATIISIATTVAISFIFSKLYIFKATLKNA